MRKSLTFVFTGLLFAFASCSQSEPEMPAGEMADGSRTEASAVAYDTRFPFPVWTDEQGEMHFEIDLDCSEAPAQSTLLVNIAGKGWRLDKCYDYEVIEAFPPYHDKIVSLREFDYLYEIAGGDPTLKYFVDSDSEYTVYYRWWDIPGSVPDDQLSMHYAIDTESYTYNEETGVLDLHVLAWYKVIKSTPDELWLGSARGKNRSFLRMIAVAADEVEQWKAEYGG